MGGAQANKRFEPKRAFVTVLPPLLSPGSYVARKAPWMADLRGFSFMGRVGFEPTTLGRVLTERSWQAASS